MDLIDRQAAIDAIDKHCDVICQYSKKQRSVMCGACSLGTAFDVIENLPSAQPYTEAEIQKMQELEQAELQKAYECGRESAQPEIIRCKDCKHYYEGGWYCSAWNNSPGFPMVTEKGYCNLAERREE